MIASSLKIGKFYEIWKCDLVLTSYTYAAFCSDAPSVFDGPTTPFICRLSSQNVFGSQLLYKRINDS